MRRKTGRATAVAAPEVLRASQPEDILALVPYLLGFHPAESLVALFLRGNRVELTSRSDLALSSDPAELIEHLELTAQRAGTRSVLLIGYGSDEAIADFMRDLAGWPVTTEGLTGFELVEVLAVSPNRWWSVSCADENCCPRAGKPYDVAAHPLAAAAVWAGLPAVGTREELAALAAGPAAADLERLRGLVGDAKQRLAGLSRRRRRTRMRQLMSIGLATPGLTEDQAVEIAALAADLIVRDVALTMMSRVEVDQHLALWVRVVAAAPPELAAAPLGMLAMASWLGGGGALLNCCISRLETVAPDYGLLQICRDISRRAIPPSYFDYLVA